MLVYPNMQIAKLQLVSFLSSTLRLSNYLIDYKSSWEHYFMLIYIEMIAIEKITIWIY